MPERGRHGAQQPLFQYGELGEAKGKTSIVPQGTEITEVILQTLKLERERAQVECAPRHLNLHQCLRRLAIGPGKCHRRIPADARREALCFAKRHFGEAAFDALVHVAEPLLETQYFLAHNR